MSSSFIKLLLFILVSFHSFQVWASSTLATGSYKVDLIVLDSDEKYPVSITFKSFTGKDLKNYVTDFNINYSSYGCKATNKKVSYSTNFIEVDENVRVGKEYCEDSKYLIFPKKTTTSTKDIFEKIINVTDGKNINTIINKVSFTPNSYTKFLLKKNFTSFDDVIASNSYQTIHSFIKATTRKSPFYPGAVKSLEKIVLSSGNIRLHKGFLAKYQYGVYKVESSLTKLYQKQKTPESYYQAYRLSKNTKDLHQAFYLANARGGLDSFIEQHSELEKTPNLRAIKLKLYRDEKSFNGYLKAFAISQDKRDIKLAFDNVKNKIEEQKAEQSLEDFLYPMEEQAKACLSGSISPRMRNKYPELTSLCDSPDRDNMAIGLCLAIAGGGCEILTSQIDNPIVQKLPKSLCRDAISKVATGTTEFSDFEIFHIVDALAYARKKSLSSDNSWVNYLLGMPLALTEGSTRMAVSDGCKVKLRSKCAILYEVCR
jgi:hypothetical protein